MRYPTGLDNIVRSATLAATNTVPSSAHELVSRDAAGGGTVRLGGSYSGADDAVVDIEVLSLTINGSPRISTPVYAGVGNGAIASIAADSGIAAQVFTVTCIDAGIPTRQAWAPFQSVNLRAQAAGSGGNNLSLRVSQAGLTATATDYAVTAEIPADTSELVGDQFNFGAVTLEPEGTVPADAPRIRFGDDVTVYRHWRTFVGGRYRYHLSPPLQRAVPAGTRVYAITGGRTVSVYDGASEEESYSGVTSLYSLLSQIAASSTLIEVDGVIAQDRRPGGMACDDLSIYTASYSAGSVRDGTEYIRRATVQLTVPSAAPTETLRLECVGAQISGAELWRLSGTVSGTLGDTTSGEALTAGGYVVTVPVQLPPASAPAGSKAAWLELLTRDSGARIPSLCVRNFRLGAEAEEHTYVFEWRPRPGEECDCSTVPVSGGPNDDWLGIDDEEANVSNLPAAIKSRMEAICNWQATSLGNNVAFTANAGDVLYQQLTEREFGIAEDAYSSVLTGFAESFSATFEVDRMDVEAITRVWRFLKTHLIAIHEAKGSPESLESAVTTAWDDMFAYMEGFLEPLSASGPVGADVWRAAIASAVAINVGTGGSNGQSNNAYAVGAQIGRALAEARNKSIDAEPVMRVAEAQMAKVYVAADLLPPFDSAGRRGNGVWQDHGGNHWFESQDGLLPIQPGHYYHSCTMQVDDNGLEQPVPTGKFGIGVAIGCEELLRVGDKLLVRTVPFGNARSTYQQGDWIEWEIVRADPVALGGGQTGNDTITFGVRGSVAGALANYELITTAPAGYDDGGLSFVIEPGGIAFQPGDRWTFSAEGGEFRYRIDGGGWTTTDIAASVALGSGISAEFVSGATPSWSVGDLYQLRMLASNGAGRARAPDDESMAWTGSLQLDITPDGSGQADTLLIAGHTIPSTATVTLLGSNDDWATTAFEQEVPWAAGSMALLFAATTCAKWRLTVDDAGSADWVYLGVPERPIVSGTDSVEHGRWRRSMRMANGQRTRAIGGSVIHTDCDQASVDALLTAIEYAHEHDDSRIGAVSPEGEAVLCTVSDVLDLDDPYGFQPPAAERRVGFSLTLTPR